MSSVFKMLFSAALTPGLALAVGASIYYDHGPFVWSYSPPSQANSRRRVTFGQTILSHAARSAQSQVTDDVDAHDIDEQKQSLNGVPFAHVPPVFGLFFPRKFALSHAGLGLSSIKHSASAVIDFKSVRAFSTDTSAISSFVERVKDACEALFLGLQDLSDLSAPLASETFFQSSSPEVESLPLAETPSSAGLLVDTHGFEEVGGDLHLGAVGYQNDGCLPPPPAGISDTTDSSSVSMPPCKLNKDAPVFIPRAAVLNLVPNIVRPRSKRKVKALTTPPVRGKENQWMTPNIESQARSRTDAFILQARAKLPPAINPYSKVRRKGIGTFNVMKHFKLASSAVVILEPQAPSETSSSTSAASSGAASSPSLSPDDLVLVTSESLLSQASSPPLERFPSSSSPIPSVRSMSELLVVRDAPLAIACTVSLNNLALI